MDRTKEDIYRNGVKCCVVLCCEEERNSHRFEGGINDDRIQIFG